MTRADREALRKSVERTTPPELSYLEKVDFDRGDTAYEIHGHSKDGKESVFVAFRTQDHEPPMRAKFNAELFLDARHNIITLLNALDRAEVEIEYLRAVVQQKNCGLKKAQEWIDSALEANSDALNKDPNS